MHRIWWLILQKRQPQHLSGLKQHTFVSAHVSPSGLTFVIPYFFFFNFSHFNTDQHVRLISAPSPPNPEAGTASASLSEKTKVEGHQLHWTLNFTLSLFVLILTDLASFRLAVLEKSLISSILRGMAVAGTSASHTFL